MPETRPRHDQDSAQDAVGARPFEQPLDDWLGDISDEDWNEDATGRGGRRQTTLAHQELSVPEATRRRGTAVDRPAPTPSFADAKPRRTAAEQRRLVAGLVLLVLLVLAVVSAVLLLGGGDDTPTTVPDPAVSTPAETTPSATPTPPSPSPAPSTTPSTEGDSAFTLPEGTKLQLGEDGDPAVIRELQQALSAAGFNPGPADGVFGPQTEAAVTAFQEANGLSVDGRVGPETTAALNTALAGG